MSTIRPGILAQFTNALEGHSGTYPDGPVRVVAAGEASACVIYEPLPEGTYVREQFHVSIEELSAIPGPSHLWYRVDWKDANGADQTAHQERNLPDPCRDEAAFIERLLLEGATQIVIHRNED